MPTRHLLDPHAGGQARSAALRALGTVVPAVWPGGVECWAVVGHRELETVLTRPLFARSPPTGGPSPRVRSRRTGP